MLLWMHIFPRLPLWTAQVHSTERSVIDILREEDPQDEMAISRPAQDKKEKKR